MTEEKCTYSKVLFKDIKSVPFLILITIFLVSIFSDVWILWDGGQFHFQNFFIGNINNAWDFTRITSIIMSEFWDLAYVRLGGTNFTVSRYLFSIGHVYHIFFPFFLLTYLKYKEPELNEWASRSMNYYLLSLVIYLGNSYMFYVSEMKEAHTLTWVALIAFQSMYNAPGNQTFKNTIFWNVSILSLFTYPLGIFSFLFIFLYEMRPSKLRDSRAPFDWKIFSLLLVLFSVAFLITYTIMWPSGTDLFYSFKSLATNSTSKMMVAALILLFVLRPFFRWYYLILVPVLFAVYVNGEMFAPWHSAAGRFFGIGLVVVFQFGYVFLSPHFPNWHIGLRNRAYALSTFVILLISYQSYQINLYKNHLLTLIDEESRVLTFEEAFLRIPEPWRYYMSEPFIRQQTISFLLLRGEKTIVKYIDKRHDDVHIDSIDMMTDEVRARRTAAKGLTFKGDFVALIKKQKPKGPYLQ